MPVNQFNIGSDTTLTIVSDGSILASLILTEFDAKQLAADIDSKGIDGVNRYRFVEEGWEGTFGYDRADSGLDDYFAAKEAARYAGTPAPIATISETTVNSWDLSVVKYRYDGVTMKFDSIGMRKGDSKVEEKVTFKASRRIKVA